ncbi:MAG: NIL domain-containing protein [Endomicrobia bacterium]|nr:NIL domain-containing protein [Endomicrobiia bacterium]MDW8056414.1 NIL domain-containing protein [Elusimicrobiota bacterium]
MVKKTIKLIFPQHLIKQPVTYKTAIKYKVIPNIRRAKVTETVGELVLELEGEQKNIDKAIKHFIKLGIDVEPIEGDLID